MNGEKKGSLKSEEKEREEKGREWEHSTGAVAFPPPECPGWQRRAGSWKDNFTRAGQQRKHCKDQPEREISRSRKTRKEQT